MSYLQNISSDESSSILLRCLFLTFITISLSMHIPLNRVRNLQKIIVVFCFLRYTKLATCTRDIISDAPTVNSNTVNRHVFECV